MAGEASTTQLNILNDTRPSFEWSLGNDYDQDGLGLMDFFDDYGKRMAVEDTQLYRITIRKYNKNL